VGETRYGEPLFTYTDKVAYQHKVYPFTIPLSEISDSVPENIELAFSGYGTFAAPQMYTFYYEVLLDTGDGGGEVTVHQAGGTETISGVDYRVGARVEYEFINDVICDDGGCEGVWICTVTAVDNFVSEWNGTDFVDTTAYGESSYPITGRFGRDNTMAVEFYVPTAAIDGYDGTLTGVFHASMAAAFNDFTSPFQYRQSSISVPTMTEWGMLIFILALMIGAIWALKSNRHRNAALCVILVCFAAGMAWAATIIINGDTGDWNGIQPIVADVANDSSVDFDPFIAANEDIRWGYVTSDSTNLYFRIDYTGSTEFGPGVGQGVD
jgi:hypothetical protein